MSTLNYSHQSYDLEECLLPTFINVYFYFYENFWFINVSKLISQRLLHLQYKLYHCTVYVCYIFRRQTDRQT